MFGFLKEYTVYLRNDTNINFPEQCIICGQRCINEKFEIVGYYEKSKTISFLNFKKYFPKKLKFLVPLHKKCNEGLKNKDALRNSILIGLFFVILSAIFLIKNRFDRWTWVKAGVTIPIMHYLLNIFWFPIPIDISKSDLRTKFKFGSKKYADEFEKLNKANLFDLGQLFQSN